MRLCILIFAVFISSCGEKIDYNEEEIFNNHVTAVLNNNTSLSGQIIPRKLTYQIFSDEAPIGQMETQISGKYNVTQKIMIKDGPTLTKTLVGENAGYLVTKDDKRDLKKGEILMLKLVAAYSDWLGYHNEGRTFEVTDVEKVNEEPCYVIEIKTESGEKACEIYVSQSSHLIMKRVEKKTEVFYDDYQLQNNLYIPHTVKIKSSQTIRFQLNSIEFLNT